MASAPRVNDLTAFARKRMEGTMIRDTSMSLIAAVVLFGIGVLSIAGAYHGTIAFDNQPDGMVTQIYTFEMGTGGQQDAMLASAAQPTGSQVRR